MRFSPEDRQRAMELAKEFGLEVSFDNEASGIFVGDSICPDHQLEDVFHDLFQGEFSDELVTEPLDLNILVTVHTKTMEIELNPEKNFLGKSLTQEAA